MDSFGSSADKTLKISIQILKAKAKLGSSKAS